MELSLHIHDEHLRTKGNECLIQRLRERHTHSIQPSAPPTPSQPQTGNSLPSLQTPTNTPTRTNTSLTDPEEDVDFPEICEISKFRELIDAYQAQLHEDKIDNDPIIASDEPYPLIPIARLFDFMDLSWSNIVNEGSERNFEAELALYDLLDRDADAEADIDLDLDGTTEQAYLG